MDEEEDEDSNLNGCFVHSKCIVVMTSNNVIHKKVTNRSQTAQSMLSDKFLLVLFLLVFSNLFYGVVRAENTSLVRTNVNSRTGKFIDYSDKVSFSKRRIRHDTTKVTSNNELLISFEQVPSSGSEINTADEDYVRDQPFIDEYSRRLLGEKSENEGSKLKKENAEVTVMDGVEAEKLVSPTSNNCLCFGGKKKMLKTSQEVTINVQHRILNTSEGISAGMIYQILIYSPKKIREAHIFSENEEGEPVGVFVPSHKPCPNAVQLLGNKINDSQILLNWSLPTNNQNSALSYVIFRSCYQLFEHNRITTYEVVSKIPVLKGCEFHVFPLRGNISSVDLFDGSEEINNCSIIFPHKFDNSSIPHSRQRGLIVKLTRLNVQCNSGNISFVFNGSSVTLCGKLEEINDSNREYHFPPWPYRPRLVLMGRPVFAISYQLVDFCYNVSMTAPNDSITISPLLKIFCNFKISLPYGFRVNVSLGFKLNTLPKMSKQTFANETISAEMLMNETSKEPVFSQIPFTAADPTCAGLSLRYWDSNHSQVMCVQNPNVFTDLRYNVITEENQFRLRIASNVDNKITFHLMYEAVEISEIVGGCGFGSVTINSFCVNVVDDIHLNWMQAEETCARQGGHLASVLDEQSQKLIDKFLLQSPGYQDYNSYWIGASDIGHEGEFTWADSLSFSYTNWFSGWPLHGYYNRQPNDDGFSSQDCVELRRQYVSPAGISSNGSKVRLTSTFTWNDRDCQTKNYFLCEFLKIPSSSVDQLPNFKKLECDQVLNLSENNDRAVISSPSFPQNYPGDKNCLIQLIAPPSFKVIIVFEEFVLEDEPNCSYDYLEIFENSTSNSSSASSIANNNTSESTRRFCGDWSDKLKLLRYVSKGPQLFLRFIADYSHSFSGYKAHVSIDQVKTECSDNRLQVFNGLCYLFVSYPQVTWQTAQDICVGIQGNLASVHSLEEEQFVVAKIRESHEYTTSTIYWLGGKFNIYDEWKWVDNSSIIFNAWVPMRSNLKLSKSNENNTCLGIQWIPSPSSSLPSGLYWVPVSCNKIGGYVCKIPSEVSSAKKVNLNSTTSGMEGELTSPNFPGNYYHNLDYWLKIVGPDNTRIIIQFHTFDLEDQKNCLYDFLEIYNITNNEVSSKKSDFVRHCGHHHSNSLHRNEAILRFHSDYSVAGAGFLATWKAVDISGCPVQTLTAKEGIVTSPNYPNFMLANLRCTTTILAPAGRQVWLELIDWDFYRKQNLEENTISESDLYLFVSNKDKLYPLLDANILTDGVYLSYGEFMRIHLRTGGAPNGRGFKGAYKTISVLSATRVINLRNDSTGNIYHLNFPLNPVPGLNFVQRFVAPLGYSIQVLFYQVVPSSLGVAGKTVCQEGENNGFIEVRDHYADRNGTWWQFCESTHSETLNHLAITSYLNTITIKQNSYNSRKGVLLNASLSVIPDLNFKSKILQFPQDYAVESCYPNPCHNNGKCISDEFSKHCECISHFTGLFCALTICDVNPCVFGVCELTPDHFKCVCQVGYQGKLCDKKMKPCSTNPCEGRGECVEKTNFTFTCLCHAWWEGEKCDKKIANIPFKPLTERMLEEPFWLGLLTVFIVLSIIGLVWCARRHFPEKLEKLLAEEAERNRHYSSSGRPATSRAEMAAQNGVAMPMNTSQSNTANSSPNPRTLFGRLGIRKPSLFSLTSPLQSTHTARTFSLDDLFKPSSSRSQMSYKHRSNGNPRKKSIDKALLKKQSSSMDENRLEQGKDRIETIELKDSLSTSTSVFMSRENSTEKATEETSFICPIADKNISDKRAEFVANKSEKKVHFARLMSKVHAEISANYVDIGLLKGEEENNTESCEDEKPLTASTQTLNYQPKSPHSTSSNQGSDSLSSSEITLISASGEKLNSRRPSLLTLASNGRCQKAASADSILAMFRKFSLSTGPASECASNFVSASTSPTASSPQEEIADSDNSSLSSSFHLNTVSMSESPPCAPKFHSSTIQVPVLDPLNSQNSSCNIASSNLLHPPTILLEVPNKCLSPIHEVPTPSPSPSMTPLLQRHCVCSDARVELSSEDSLDVSNRSFRRAEEVAQHIVEDSRNTDLSIAVSSVPSASKSVDIPRSLVIPTFTIQGPSPIDEAPKIVLCPGTPPDENRNHFLCSRTGDRRSSEQCILPPIITVTFTDMDSDPDYPNAKCGSTSTNTTSFLSPFSGCSRADRTASESNLSSSGYSSMASPSPSRCGSNNPLCPSEGEDHHHSPRKPSPLLRSPSAGSAGSDGNNAVLPSDSETMSDDHQIESNDEGFIIDQLDEKIHMGELKSAKELEMFIEGNGKCDKELVDLLYLNPVPIPIPIPIRNRQNYCAGSDQYLDEKLTNPMYKKQQSNSVETPDCTVDIKLPKISLQLPSIVVEATSSVNENRSPVSSRSESPLSDRATGLGRFSPMFYGKLTDSDGIYDWTSSDCVKPVHRKHFGRRKERLRSKSPNVRPKSGSSPLLLDVPKKQNQPEKCRKPSPKRRSRSRLIKASSSSSSSSECTRSCSSKLFVQKLYSPRKIKYSSRDSSCSTNEENSGDEDLEDKNVEIDHIKHELDNSEIKACPVHQRFSFIGKLSSMLLHEKNDEAKYSTSVRLLSRSPSWEVNQDRQSQTYIFPDPE